MFSPPADDDVLRAVLDQDVAGLVERRHVAGPEPAVADGRRGRVRVAVVAGHDAVAADDDLADPLAVRPHIAPLAVDHPELDARDRPAGERLPLVAPLGRLGVRHDRARLGERQDRRRLRQAIADDRLDAELLLERLHEGRRGRRSPDDHLAQAREVEARALVMVDERVEDRRHRQQPRHAVALDELHERHRVEAPEHHVAAADHGQEMGDAPAVDVEERDHVEDHVLLAEPERDLRVDGVEVELAVGERDALRAGRSCRSCRRARRSRSRRSAGGAARASRRTGAPRTRRSRCRRARPRGSRTAAAS